MDHESARSALMESLTRPCGTPCTWRADRDAYINECKAELLAHLIEPRPVQAATIVTGRPQGVVKRPEPQSFIAIAKRDDIWLLFDPCEAKFFKAFGSDPDERALDVLEFGSHDALMEWLG